jgi:hypothetical protein
MQQQSAIQQQKDLILTGQGSTSDVTIKNDADGTVFYVPTGTSDAFFKGKVYLVPNNGSTSTCSIELGQDRTGDGYAYIDLIGDATYTDFGLRIIRGNSGANTISQINHRGTGDFSLLCTEAAPMTFGTSNAERMRIDASGNLLVGGTSQLNGTGTSNYGGFACVRSPGATAGKFWNAPYVASNNTLYIINNSNAGVYMLDGQTAFSANSDERLKDIIEPIVNATEKVSSLRAVIGKYKTDEEGKRRSFLIAQDVQAVLPEAVTASKLPNSEDDTEYLGIAYTEVIPLLVAAIKEQQATIEALEARITALEG